MVKYKKSEKKNTDQAREELEMLEDLPLVGGLIKGLGKFIDLAEKVEEAGGEIRKEGKIRGLGKGKDAKGVYGFSIRSGIGGRPRVQTFGNIRPVEKKAGKKEVEVVENREPIVDVFNEKDHILIIAELPGIDEKAIKLDLKKDILIIEAGNQDRKYAKEILLPDSVDFQSRKIDFKNGILKVKLKKIF
ncbi:Hsp20/alpha crystallin family protein [Candidatus Parcubacteria bacterium]|nr:Hsp20/alpha crystallin family protein [Candidatus Parcubacteria bacterium]MCG2698330.1 Hsp20/alpha crystallin family protein [Candidatus Parcubacteria bacterium]MCG2700979.1 Hsp20/alpha crystallin family protein [Candidatus Parcubacteria bacterium]